jgi:serine protease inhibitor
MPKLHLHTQTSLNGPLEALGMTDAFGPAADFSGITTRCRCASRSSNTPLT